MGLDELPVLELFSVDHGCNLRQLSYQVQAVFVHHLPVLALVHAARVGGGKLAVTLQEVVITRRGWDCQKDDQWGNKEGVGMLEG